jgi:anti-anti-sigma factor
MSYLQTCVKGNCRQAKARILLDVTHVRYLSSSMLGQLARLARDVASSRGQLKITGLGPVLRDTFRIGYLEPLFAIYDDNAFALKAFHKHLPILATLAPAPVRPHPRPLTRVPWVVAMNGSTCP